MRRVVCHQPGPLDDLVIEDGPALEAGPGQVVVDVKAAGVNFVDALFVQGRYQIKPPTPFTPGSDIAGVVSEVGDGVGGVAVGDRVIASVGIGAFAEQAVLSAGALFPLPDGVAFELGAAVPQSYATAVYSFTRCAPLAEGQWVLVLGAGGGVGRACVDVARGMGARVIGVGSSEEKRQAAVEAGAEATIDVSEDIKTRAREISGGGVDVVADPVGGDLAEPALRALRWGGRYLVIGFVAGIPRLPLNQVLLNSRSLIGVEWGAWAGRFPDENRVLIADVLDQVANGTLRPAMPTVAKLDEVVQVLHDFEDRKITGRVVLVP
jgi:NADPH2:quinone reductase